MAKGKQKNCRLCLKTLDDDYNVIDEITREIFEVLLLKVDLFVCEEPAVCKSCMESIQEAFSFKATCISVDEQVVSLAKNRNSTELDIRDVYLNESENKSLAFNEDYSICRFCLQCLKKNCFSLLNDLKENVADEILLKCIPELDLNIIKEPVVCAACTKYLESYYNFALKCQITEENIMKYCEVEGTECNGQIVLSNVLNFLFNGIGECIGNHSKINALKREDNLFQNKEDTYSDLHNVLKIEDEELVIKDESNCVYCNTEVNMCGETKQKEIVESDLMSHKVSPEKQMLIHKDNSEATMLTRNNSSDIIMHRCDKCTFEAKHKNSLNKHMLIHKSNSEVTMYKCNLCNYETKWKNHLKQHVLTHKNSADVVMYKCERCTFQTKYKNNLKGHMLIHKGRSEVTMYKCNLCNYQAKWKNYLKDHMLTHRDSSDVVMYRCERCTFQTKYKNNLKGHMLIHKSNSEVTMYKCKLCNYETKRQSCLKQHLLTHKDSADAVMYKCEKCTFQTKHKRSLIAHMLIHRGNSEVTMYRCNICNHESKRKMDLKKHILTHKDSSVLLMYCTFKTRNKHNLKSHMLIHKSNQK